jgi:hypothetical protein
MRIEQIQSLSELTEQAVQIGDMESLVNIYKIILQAEIDNPFINPEGSEWFWVQVPPDMWEGIQEQAENI